MEKIVGSYLPSCVLAVILLTACTPQQKTTADGNAVKRSAPTPLTPVKLTGIQVSAKRDASAPNPKPIEVGDAVVITVTTQGNGAMNFNVRLISLEEGSAVAEAAGHSTGQSASKVILDTPSDWKPGRYLVEVVSGNDVLHRELSIFPSRPAQDQSPVSVSK